MTPELEQRLTHWNEVQVAITKLREQAAPLVEAERALRAEILELAFPNRDEGTNYLELSNDWKLKATVKIDRKVDESTLVAVSAQLLQMGRIPEKLVRFKPELELREYRTLTEEQRQVFDQTLIIKPAAPVLELVAPKLKEG